MHANFYGNEEYHQARKRFVYKISCNRTPDNIALHRQQGGLTSKPAPGSMSHFIWEQQYEMDDALLDRQHKDFFDLARKLVDSRSKDELLQNLPPFYRHVKEHLSAEEEFMNQLNYPGSEGHEKEHNRMLKNLVEMDGKINQDNWDISDTQRFFDGWGKHIIHSDMSFNSYMKAYHERA